MRPLRKDISSLYWEGPEGPGDVLVRVGPAAFRRFDRRMDGQIASLMDHFARPVAPSMELLEACLGSGEK